MDHQQRKRKQITSRKQFKKEDSLLTILIEQNIHIRSLHNIILSFVSIFTFSTIGDYFIHRQKFVRDYELFYWNVKELPQFFYVWTLKHAMLLLVLYPLILARSYIKYRRIQLYIAKQKTCDPESLAEVSRLSTLETIFFTFGYLLVLMFCIVYTCWYTVNHQLNLTITFALMMEMVRLCMKAHSYFIETNKLSLDSKVNEKLISSIQQNAKSTYSNSPIYPKLFSLIYYLFAPTLLFRDSYPRNDTIRWKFVLSLSFQMILCILTGYIAICRVLVDNYSTIGLVPYRLENLFQNFSTTMMFGFVIFFLAFYGLLHLWHNIFAELTRFADRRFYSEWWESISLKEYYRKWNHLVQDWLFEYIYKPVYNHFQSSTIAIFVVIMISGVVHEIILALTLKFVFPALFLAFAVFGHIYFLLTKNLKRTNIHNIIFSTINIFGWGVLCLLYSLEYYSRINCPKQNSTMLDMFIPRLISCVKT